MVAKKRDIKAFIEKSRENMHYIMQHKTGKDVEYGWYHGRIDGVASLAEREEPEINPLDLGVRICPDYGALCYCVSVQKGVHTLLHGTKGCASIQKAQVDILFGGPGRPLGAYHTTAMGKVDTILGSEEKLRKAIIEIDRDYHPDMLVVMKGCASAIIGDDISGICESIKDKVSCRLLPIDLGGFSSRHQTYWQSEYLLAFAQRFMEEPKEKIPNSVNYIASNSAICPKEFRGHDDFDEVERVLNRMGVKVHCTLPGSEPIDKQVTAASASLNMLRCSGSGLKFARYMEERFGMPYVATSIPIGIETTTELYLGVIEALGLGDEAIKVLEEEIEEADRALEPYRQKLRGKRFALSLGSNRLPAHARMAMNDLGMEPVFLGVHSLHEKGFPNIDILARQLAEKGYDPDVISEPAYYEEAEVIDRLQPDIWLNDGTQSIMSLDHGMPQLSSMYPLNPEGCRGGYRGVALWAKQIIRELENFAPLVRRYARYTPKNS